MLGLFEKKEGDLIPFRFRFQVSRKAVLYAMDVVSLIALGFFQRLFHFDLIDATLDSHGHVFGNDVARWDFEHSLLINEVENCVV